MTYRGQSSVCFVYKTNGNVANKTKSTAWDVLGFIPFTNLCALTHANLQDIFNNRTVLPHKVFFVQMVPH